ncbi:MAG TPA: hypothetical protein VEB20_06410 [Azospirillaceae bacterium]|nr:hypothetical protein [Azospirillaceae bacterium]
MGADGRQEERARLIPTWIGRLMAGIAARQTADAGAGAWRAPEAPLRAEDYPGLLDARCDGPAPQDFLTSSP